MIIIDVICHFLFTPINLLIYSFILEESTKFICFFLACQYYCKAALGYLPSKHKWLLLLRILMLAGFSIMFIGVVGLLIKNGVTDNQKDMDLLCKQPLFLVLRSGGEIIVFFFLVIGIVITLQIKNQERETTYERTKQLRGQKRALKKLW